MAARLLPALRVGVPFADGDAQGPRKGTRMTVNDATIDAASARLASAMSAAHVTPQGGGAEVAETSSSAPAAAPPSGDATDFVADAPAADAPRTGTRPSSTGTGDAARGAAAGPETTYASTGADAADEGAGLTAGDGPLTPYDASSASYAAEARAAADAAGSGSVDAEVAVSPSGVDVEDTVRGSHPAPMDAKVGPGATTTTSSASDRDGGPTSVGEAVADVIATAREYNATNGTKGYNIAWDALFKQLGVNDGNRKAIAEAKLSDDDLESVAVSLVDEPVPGHDAGSVASSDGPTAGDVMPAGQPGTQDAAGTDATTGAQVEGEPMSDAWRTKFTKVMTDQGIPAAEIKQQLDAVAGQPFTEAELQQSYDGMVAALGDFPKWRAKYEQLMTDMELPAKDREQALEALATSGLTDAQLQESYDGAVAELEARKPGWNDEWANKFKALDLPQELIDQVKNSGTPQAGLEQGYKQLLDTKMAYSNDGRLDRLIDAEATAEEKWSVMTQGLEGEKFDEAIDAIDSAHVSGWERVGSFALNLVPGAFAVQYAFGKDFVTGENIDRSNPLNMLGAVASVIPAATLGRAAITGGLKLGAVGGAKAGLAALTAGKAGQGTIDAFKGAGVVAGKTSLTGLDAVKMSIPIFNKFGQAKALRAFGGGYQQSIKGTASQAAERAVAGGGTAIDKTVQKAIIKDLRTGKVGADELAELVTKTRTTAGGGSAGAFVHSADDVAATANQYGFLVGKARGAKVGNQSGLYRFNPSTSKTGVSAIDGQPNVFALDRGVDFATKGGYAQRTGVIAGAERPVGHPAAAGGGGTAVTPGSSTSVASSGDDAATAAATSGRHVGPDDVPAPDVLATGGSQASAASQRIADLQARTPRLFPTLRNKQAGVAYATGLQNMSEAQRTATAVAIAAKAKDLGIGGLSRLSSGSNWRAAKVASVVDNGIGGTQRWVPRNASMAAKSLVGFTAAPLAAAGMLAPTGGPLGDSLRWKPVVQYFKHRDEILAQEEREAARRPGAEQEQADLERLYQEQQAAEAAAGRGAGATDAAGAAGEVQPTATDLASATEPVVLGDSTSGGQYVYDPGFGAVVDTATNDVYDLETQQLIGNLADLAPSDATGQAATTGAAGRTTATADATAAGTAPAGSSSASTSSEVYQDPKTGYFVDPASGLAADPATGNVYDSATGDLVGNTNDQTAASA